MWGFFREKKGGKDIGKGFTPDFQLCKMITEWLETSNRSPFGFLLVSLFLILPSELQTHECFLCAEPPPVVVGRSGSGKQSNQLPITRVKNIIKSDPDITLASQEATLVISKV